MNYTHMLDRFTTSLEINIDALHRSPEIKRALTVCLYTWAIFAGTLTLATLVNIFG